jgi:hypothetical protein
MAEGLRVPNQLDINEGNIAENYKKWKRQVEIYLMASGVCTKNKETQTAIILHCAGPSVIDHSLNPTQRKTHRTIIRAKTM